MVAQLQPGMLTSSFFPLPFTANPPCMKRLSSVDHNEPVQKRTAAALEDKVVGSEVRISLCIWRENPHVLASTFVHVLIVFGRLLDRGHWTLHALNANSICRICSCMLTSIFLWSSFEAWISTPHFLSSMPASIWSLGISNQLFLGC